MTFLYDKGSAVDATFGSSGCFGASGADGDRYHTTSNTTLTLTDYSINDSLILVSRLSILTKLFIFTNNKCKKIIISKLN